MKSFRQANGYAYRGGIVKAAWIISAVAAMWATCSFAQAPLAWRACGAEIQKLCGLGTGRARAGDAACIKDHLKDLSEPCRARLARWAVESKSCAADVKKRCADTRPGRGRIADCLKPSLADLSDACKNSVVRAVVRRR